MKHLISILSILLINYQPINSQVKTEKATVLWGPELKESKKSTLSDVIAFDQSGIYVSKFKRKGLAGIEYVLEHFDAKLNKTKSEVLNLGKKDKRVLEQMIHFNDVLYVFSSKSLNDIKKNILFVETINKKTFAQTTI